MADFCPPRTRADPLGLRRTPSGPARSPPKIPPRRTPPLPPDLRRTSATFGGVRAGPSGPDADWRKLPPIGLRRTFRRGQKSASPPSSGLFGGLRRTRRGQKSAADFHLGGGLRHHADSLADFRGGLLSAYWRTFVHLLADFCPPRKTTSGHDLAADCQQNF